MTKEEYEKDLKKRQKQHLNRMRNLQDKDWKPCVHDSCPHCIGTGVRLDGSQCIHMIYCNCPKCSPISQIGNPVTISGASKISEITTSNTFILGPDFNGKIYNTFNP